MSHSRHVARTLRRNGALLLIAWLLTACDAAHQAARPDAPAETHQGTGEAGATQSPAKPTRTTKGELDVAAMLPVGTLTVDIMEFALPMNVAKTGETTLKVSSPAEGRLVLDGGEELPELTGLEFDLEQFAHLALGTLQESGRQVLYYDVKRAEDGFVFKQITIILYYDLPAAGDTDQERTDEQPQQELS